MSDIKVQTVRAEVSPRQVASTPPSENRLNTSSSASDNSVSLTTAASDLAEVAKSQGNSAQQAPSATDEQGLAKGEVEAAVARLNEFVQETERRLDFQIDEDSGRSVIRVYDKGTNELVRQIPSEQALELARRLGNDEPSFLFNAEV